MEVDEKDELKDVVEEKAPRGGAAGAAVGAGAIVDVEPDEWADGLPTVRRKGQDKSKDKSKAKGSTGKGKYKGGVQGGEDKSKDEDLWGAAALHAAMQRCQAPSTSEERILWLMAELGVPRREATMYVNAMGMTGSSG